MSTFVCWDAEAALARLYSCVAAPACRYRASTFFWTSSTAGFGSAGAAVALCVESSVTEASAAVVSPTAGVVVRTFVRGLRCDAKTGISFRGPPTGLAVGFGRNGRLSYGPDARTRTDSPRCCVWVPGSELPGRQDGFGRGVR